MKNKDEMLKLLNKRIPYFSISIQEKLRLEPLKALSYLALKVPSLYCPNGIKVNIRAFWGSQMVGVLPDAISSVIYLNEFFEEGLTKMLIEHLNEGMAVIDIGAHIGYFSLLSSELVGEKGRVFAFEPTPSIFAILKENAKTKNNIVTNNFAVFSRAMELEFRDFGLRYSCFNSFTKSKLKSDEKVRYKKIKVNAITLDEYVEDNKIEPDFVKIDAENAEFEILKGMDKTIAKYKPTISLEVSEEVDGVASSYECVKHLLNKGYESYCFENGKVKPHEIKQKYEYDNLLFIPD